ncbi:MAG: tetratricopeptide repeat protein [Flavobacterium sp.]|nr:tetratricopeptide repeat protein [Flavobacterium sp.]
MKKSPLLILFFSLTFVCCTQKKKTEKDTFLKESYQSLERNEKIRVLDSLTFFIADHKADTSALNLLFDLSTEYYYLNESKKSFDVSQKAFIMAETLKDTFKMARANYYIGDSYETTKKDSAFFYYVKAEKLYQAILDNERVGRMQFNKGYILFYEGNYTECELELTKAFYNLKNSENHKLKYLVYNLMGNCQEKLEDYETAMKYHESALEELEKLKKTGEDEATINNYLLSSYINICNIYDAKKEYNKSEITLEKLLNNRNPEENIKIYYKALNNLAYSRMKQGKFKDLEATFNKCLEVNIEEKNEVEELYVRLNLGEYYLIQKDTAKALTFFNESYAAATELESNKEILRSLKNLSLAEPEKASLYNEKYIKLTEELAKKQLTNRNKYARIEYETSRIESENKLLTEKNYRLIIMATVLGFLAILFLVVRHLIAQKREFSLIKQKREAEELMFNLINEQQVKLTQAKENEQNRIARELHDAIMNRVYSIRMSLGILNNSKKPDAEFQRLKYLDELHKLENSIRSISHDLKIEKFTDKIDFIDLLKELIITENNIGKTKFTLELDEAIDWNATSIIVKVTLYRILQEVLNNTIKYAEAEKCDVKIKKGAKNIAVEITDNGIGFDTEKTKKGIGLKNIYERVKECKGKISLSSTIGKGTSYFVEM